VITQNFVAPMFSRSCDPAGKRAGFSQFGEVAQQLHPDVLAHVLDVGRGQSISSANCVNEGLLALNELLLGFLVRFRRRFDKFCV
jgi:hypothetical protein